MSVLFARPRAPLVTPLGVVEVRPRAVRSLLDMPTPLLEFHILLWLNGHDRAAINKAMATAARCLADSLNHGASELVAYWQGIIQEQHNLLSRWSPRVPPRPRTGRPPTYTREELVAVLRGAISYGQQNPPERNTKSAVAGKIGTSYRQLQAWLIHYNVNWEQLLSDEIPPEK